MSRPRFNAERALLAEIEWDAKKSVALTNELIAACRFAVAAWRHEHRRCSHELCSAMRRLEKLVGQDDHLERTPSQVSAGDARLRP